MNKKITSAKDVAKEANVSQSTVSRVFTPGASASAKSRKIVMEIAKKLNYRPNALARGLITKKTGIVGLAMKDIQNPFYHEVLGMFTKKLKAIGYTVLFLYTENEEIQQEEINHFLEYNVEGIIVTDAVLSSKVVSKLQYNNIPVTLFNRYDKSVNCNSVGCDNIEASKKIAEFIYESGSREIVFITGKVNTSTSRDRQKGFTNELEKRGLIVTILEGDYTYETAFRMTTKMICDGKRPDAIFGANDITALGALDALKIKEIDVPNQTIVIGFDNIRMASWPSNGLTTWAQPIEEMVDQAINLMLINDKEAKIVFLEGHFIQRKTTK